MTTDYDRRRLARIDAERARSLRERCETCGGWYLHDTAIHYPYERCPHCATPIHPALYRAAEDR